MAKQEKQQISENKLEFLREQSSSWKKQKIITAIQEKKILNLYQSSRESKPGIASYIAIFGAILIGLGIILFYALNWNDIPKTVKVISILGFMIASYHIGYVMKFQKANFPKVGTALILLGTIIYGAGIFLIAQIYNINSHWPNAFLFWTIGVALITYTARILPTAYLMLATAIAYIFSESVFWFQFVERYANVPYAFFLIFLSTGILTYALGILHDKYKTLKNLRYPFHLFGSVLILLILFLLSFKTFVEENQTQLIEKTSILFHSHFWTIYLTISIAALIAIALCFKKRDQNTLESKELLIGTALLIVTPLLVLFANNNILLMPLFFNIILFASIIGMIQLGIAKKDKTLVNVGMIAFGITVFARYIEYLWDVINGYIFFLVAGILLIALAILLEKNRRKILEKVK